MYDTCIINCIIMFCIQLILIIALFLPITQFIFFSSLSHKKEEEASQAASLGWQGGMILVILPFIA